MRVRVIQASKSLSTTQLRSLSGDVAKVVAEGTLVMCRTPGADNAPRWSPTDRSFEDVVDGCHRIAVLIGEGAMQQLWFSSHVVFHRGHAQGFEVRTQNSSYIVEVLDEGGSARPTRRHTGTMPVYGGGK